MYEFPQSEGTDFFSWCQNNSIYKCFHELWEARCWLCSNVGLGQQLFERTKTNPGPNRQTGLIKHPRGQFLRELEDLTPALYFTRFLATLPLSPGFIIF